MLNKRECAIITAYTGVTMLSGDDLRYLYEYVSELLGHSVQTIELAVLADEIKEKAKPDFLMLCKLASDEFKEVDVEPVRHGRWIMREKDELIPTGKIAVSEGHILNKTSFDEPFTLQSANIIKIKEHRIVKIPYCSICGNYGDDEYDKTPYCPYCGAIMDGDADV